MKTKEFITELRTKDIKQLTETLIKNQDKLHDLKKQLALGGLKNMKEITQTRKQIAQISTIISDKVSQIVQTSTEESNND